MPILFFNDNMSSTNELATESTVDTKITAQLVGFNAAAISLWDSGTTYSALARVFRAGIVWETTAGVASGQPAPDVNNTDWFKVGDVYWMQKYDDAAIYALGDQVFFDHSSHGPTFWELVTNTDVVLTGDFSSDTNWDKGTGWSIAAGVASKAAGTASDLDQNTILTDTVRFKLTYTISNFVAGTATIKCGSGTSGAARSANGTFTEELVCSGSTDLIISANSTADYDIDNVIALQAGIDPDDDETKWDMMQKPNTLTFYNEDQEYDSGDVVYYGLGTAAQSGVYKANATTAAGEDPIDTSAKWDRQLMVTIDELTPTTTKGDILVENATVLARLAVGADGLVLTADAASAEGVKWSATVGTGDVVGPAASVDNRLAIFDSTTGKLLQDNTSVKVDDSDNMTGLTSIETPSIVTVSNADLILTPNGTGVIKLGQNFNTNNKDIISLASQNITFKPNGDGLFQVDYVAPTSLGQALLRTTNSKSMELELRGENSAVDLVSTGGAKIILTNLDTTNGNYSTIESRNKDNDASVILVFENDNHVSDQSTFRILTRNSSLAVGFIQDKDGHITKPKISAFNAIVSTTVSSVTGDGTAHTIIFDTEILDQNSDFNSGTGVFTAPVTGQYNFSGTVTLDNVSDAVTHTILFMNLVLSNRTYPLHQVNADSLEDGGNILRLPWAVIGADMDTGDTAKVTVQVNGATKIIDLIGTGANTNVSFQGYLAY